jgi:hypothetical protein
MTKSFAKFNEETGRFEIPSGARRQLMEIGKELGMDYNTLTKMATGSLELSDKMQKIRLEGMFVPNVTPFKIDGDLDEEALRTCVRFGSRAESLDLCHVAATEKPLTSQERKEKTLFQLC